MDFTMANAGNLVQLLRTSSKCLPKLEYVPRCWMVQQGGKGMLH